MKNPSEQTLPPENNKSETDELQEQTSTSEYYKQLIKIPNMEKGKRKEVESWMKKFIIKMLNATKVEPRKLPLMGEQHALVLCKAYKIQIVIIDNHFAELKKYWDSDSAFFSEYKELSESLSSPAPTDVKSCYLFCFNGDIDSFKCNYLDNVNHHFAYMQELPKGFYTENDIQDAYKRRGGIMDDRFNPFIVESWDQSLDKLGLGSFSLNRDEDIERDTNNHRIEMVNDAQYDSDLALASQLKKPFHEKEQIDENLTGISFGPNCVGSCFTHCIFASLLDKRCDHVWGEINLSEVGDYVVFSSSFFHRGYFPQDSKNVVVTAQLFASSNGSSTNQPEQHSPSTNLMSHIYHGQLRLSDDLTSLAQDVLLNWKSTTKLTNFDHAKNLAVKKSTPTQTLRYISHNTARFLSSRNLLTCSLLNIAISFLIRCG
jgi:hypothetical protein